MGDRFPIVLYVCNQCAVLSYETKRYDIAILVIWLAAYPLSTEYWISCCKNAKKGQRLDNL